MSFTVKVKEELLSLSWSDGSELSAIIKMSGSLGLIGGGLTLSITTESAKIARHIYELLENLYHVQPKIRYYQKTSLCKNHVCNVFAAANVREVLSDLQLADSFFGTETGINPTILEDDNKGRAYLRGVFLATGTIRDPESGKYQLEIFSVYQDHTEGLTNLMRKFILDAKIIEHRNGAVTYLQRAEDTVDFLSVIGAMECEDVFEEIKVMYETRNGVNRANNAGTANIAKAVIAGIKIISNIIKITDTVGFETLPIELQQVAKIRVENPDYSIQQIADHLEGTLTKSSVNHRLRKINKITDELQRVKGEAHYGMYNNISR